VKEKLIVFWMLLRTVWQCFGGDFRLHNQATVVKAESPSEMVALFYQTVWRNKSEAMVLLVSVADGFVS
jgi:hypothetical protein